ncbi:ribosome assembly cofactor RimP [Alkalispirochaeta alkalica]|uniref:ribosome assembly cofactor RimP n=1 Tax=Alkalispirochaeta alkalica TaxID=46356 RepID=UPI000372FF3C|nr:ribosome assembly cofactor RimP [Alkalispirochaeta alkalica]
MYNRKPEGPLAEAVREIVEPQGYRLVSFSSEVIRQRPHVHCVLHHPEGIVLDALAELHRALEPRLEALLETRDLRVEFSSPGISRVLTSFHEFDVFCGCRVQVLCPGASEWISGTILSADEGSCVIRTDDGREETFSPEMITKARLTE